MSDFIGSAPNLETLQVAAQALGFINEDGDILTNGRWPGASGSWFLNIVGEIPDSSGFWVRLRWNEGDLGGRLQTFIAALQSYGIVVYEQVLVNDELVWSSDGITPAPEWVNSIGPIA